MLPTPAAPELLTPDTLAAAARIPLERAQQWVDPLNYVLPVFEINTPRRMAAFIGQCAHESAGFTDLVENMNYSAKRLTEVWPQRFPSIEQAQPYAGQPQKLANFVYANRMGNGDEASGDGWRFIARGPLGLTGRGNYGAASQALFGGLRLLDFPEHVAESFYVGAATAAWFWTQRKLNALADAEDFEAIGNVINTGRRDRRAHGTPDRLARTEAAMEVLTA